MANGFLSYWYKDFVSVDGIVVLSITDVKGINAVDIRHYDTGLHITLSDSTGLNWADFVGDTLFPNDGRWHNVMVSWAGSEVLYRVDGSPGNISSSMVIGGGFTTVVEDSTVQIFAGIGDFSGSLSEVFILLADTHIDVGDMDVVRKFIDADGYAVRLGGDGSVPFGHDLKPDFYLAGDINTFALNVPFDNFTQTTWDSTGRALDVTEGTLLQNASDDPFPPPLAGSVGV